MDPVVSLQAEEEADGQPDDHERKLYPHRFGANLSPTFVIERPNLLTFSKDDASPSQKQKFKELVTFHGNIERRGSSLWKILQSGGAIFANSAGSEDTYELSEEVEKISFFLSHNWATPREIKVPVLKIVFNYNASVIVSLAVCFFFVAFEVHPWFPAFDSYMWDDPEKVKKRPIGCVLFGSISLLLTLFYWQDVKSLCRPRLPYVFLDKTCIHQTDDIKKREGIRSLAAFLSDSETMVVVYSDLYLRRLWTVYEVASFITLRRASSMIIIPVSFAKILMACMTLTLSSQAISDLIRHRSFVEFMNKFISGEHQDLAQQWATRVINGMVLLPITIMLRHWAREQAEIEGTVQQFSIKRAECANESDRSLVEENVTLLMADIGSEDDSDPLEEFDTLVRQKVPVAFRLCFGRTGIPWRFSYLMWSAKLFRAFDRVAADVRSMESLDVTNGMVLVGAVNQFTLALVLWPLTVACIAQVTRLWIGVHPSSIVEKALSVLFFIACALLRDWLFLLFDIYTQQALSGSQKGVTDFCLLIFIMVGCLILAYWPLNIKDREVTHGYLTKRSTGPTMTFAASVASISSSFHGFFARRRDSHSRSNSRNEIEMAERHRGLMFW